MEISSQYKEFWEDLELSQVLDGDNRSYEEIFLEEKCQFLVNQGVLQDYHLVNYVNESLFCRIDAWGFKPTVDDGIEDSLVLIVSDFHNSDNLENTTLSSFRKYLDKAKRFFKLCMQSNFRLNELEYGSAVAGLADYIYTHRLDFYNITIVGITNTGIVSRDKSLVINENTMSNVVFSYDVWDFNRIYKIEHSGLGRESVDIDFVEDYECPFGIKALKASIDCSDVSSYLFVLSGKILSRMYEIWNERLLEQNPRTFLSFTRLVNKGIRNTIKNQPERFFAFNNGISAVASGLEYNEDKQTITKISNFQIVNGGQTTASIYNAVLNAKKTKDEIELEKVFVMVKLSVIPDKNLAVELIPKISEYSNTQNKVNTSAFSMHHPYHKALEKYSRSIWTPSIPGKTDTHWYYERVEGQYKNAINLCKTKGDRTLFQLSNPKNQMFKAVDLAKFIFAFDCEPHIVCLGGEKVYKKFALKYLKVDEETGEGKITGDINEEYFKELCAKALIFRALEKRLSNGIRFVVVPYTIAAVINKLNESNYVLDYETIWKKQWENEIFFNILAEYSNRILDVIQTSMPPTKKLLSEWGKDEPCWQKVKQLDIDISPVLEFCISKSEYKEKVKVAKAEGKIDVGISYQEYVYSKGIDYWKKLYLWAEKNMHLSSREQGIIMSAITMRATPRQCEAIKKIEHRVLQEGFK